MRTNKLTKTLVALTIVGGLIGVTGCTQADRVSENISTEAENFNVMRRLVVINTVTDTPLLEVVGFFSVDVDAASKQLEITVKETDTVFKKHFVGLDAATVIYTVEDLNGTDVPTTRYQISYLPSAIVPVEFKNGEK